eukprot:2263321-Rhodomonas_salina.1
MSDLVGPGISETASLTSTRAQHPRRAPLHLRAACLCGVVHAQRRAQNTPPSHHPLAPHPLLPRRWERAVNDVAWLGGQGKEGTGAGMGRQGSAVSSLSMAEASPRGTGSAHQRRRWCEGWSDWVRSTQGLKINSDALSSDPRVLASASMQSHLAVVPERASEPRLLSSSQLGNFSSRGSS